MQLHHIEMCVTNAKSVLQYFAKLGFTLSATSKTGYCRQYVITNNRATLVVTQQPDVLQKELRSRAEWCIPALSLMDRCSAAQKSVDTVFNIALQVDDVEKLTNTMCKNGGQLLKAPSSASGDEDGSVTYSMVKTGFGNILHTLIDKKTYTGHFLPGFQRAMTNCPYGNDQQLTGNIDHITYVCHSGEMESIIEWYNNCLELKRYYINSQDELNKGMVIGKHIGIRLKAAKTEAHNNDRPLLLVLAEPLSAKTSNHVSTFLTEHGCPGIEHIAFQTADMLSTMKEMCRRGISIKQIPASYYKMIQRKYDSIFTKSCSSADLQIMRDCGILFDEETSNVTNRDISRYLFQAFTPPIFEQATFFLEFISRHGATGLGTNNIWNIMKALEADKNIQQNAQLGKASVLD